MAWFTCKCSNKLSDSQVPSENIIVAFLGLEWEEKAKKHTELAFLSPDNNVWYCPECGRIYIFKGKQQIAQYVVEREWGKDDKIQVGYSSFLKCDCGNSISNNMNTIIAYTDFEWDEKTMGVKLIKNIPKPQRDVWYCPECDKIFVFKNGTLKKQYIIEKRWME
jgi:rubrerythrin